MKHPRLIAVVFILGLSGLGLAGRQANLGNPNLSGPWAELGPFGGDVQTIVRSPKAPNDLYAVVGGYPGRIFRSRDNGKSWTRRAVLDLWFDSVVCDPLSSQTIYVPTFGYLYKSVNWGGSFSPVSYPDGGGFSYRVSMAVHPSVPNTLYFAGVPHINGQTQSYMAIYKSVDGCASWTKTELDYVLELGSESIALVISGLNPNILYFAADFGEAYGNKIFKTSDGGATWQDLTPDFLRDNGVSIYDIVLDPKDINKAYVAFNTGVARTANGGLTWSRQSSPLMFAAASVAVDPVNPNILYAPSADGTVDRGCFKSLNGGQTWKKTKTGVYGKGRKALAGGGRVTIASSAGIFASVNAGLSFLPSHKGMNAAAISGLALAPSSPNVLYAGVADYGVFKTSDGGTHWVKGGDLPLGFELYRPLIHPADSNTVYVMAAMYEDIEEAETTLYKSTDGGRSYTRILQEPFFNVVIDAQKPDRLVASGFVYAGGSNYAGVLVSENGGATWSKIRAGASVADMDESWVVLDPSNGNIMYLYDGSFKTEGLYKSLDGGASWSLLSGAIPRMGDLECLVVDPTASNVVYASAYNILWRSSDGGVRWNRFAELGTAHSIAINPLNRFELFVATGSEVLYTNNRGTSWIKLDEGFPACHHVYSLALAPVSRRIYAGTDAAGVVRRTF